MKILTLKQTMKFLKVSRWTVYRMTKSGRLPALKINGEWRFNLEDLNLFITNRLTYYGLTAIKPFFYRIAVLARYRNNPMKYYLHDEAFCGRLGNKEDYYCFMCKEQPKKGDFSEIHYLKSGKTVIISPKEFRKIASCPDEQAYWAKFFCSAYGIRQ